MRTRILALCTLALVALALTASPVNERTAEIVDMFRKTKNKQKHKRGVTVSLYLDVRGEAVVQAPSLYAGDYAVDGLDYSLDLRVSADGEVEGSGIDDGRRFVLEQGRIEGALLRATKVYSAGARKPIEGAFMNLIVHGGPSPETAKKSVTFGLGVPGPVYIREGAMTVGRLFYERN